MLTFQKVCVYEDCESENRSTCKTTEYHLKILIFWNKMWKYLAYFGEEIHWNNCTDYPNLSGVDIPNQLFCAICTIGVCSFL